VERRISKRLAAVLLAVGVGGSSLAGAGCATEQEVLESEGLGGAAGYETESQSEIMVEQSEMEDGER
jgi:hypothetical protein